MFYFILLVNENALDYKKVNLVCLETSNLFDSHKLY